MTATRDAQETPSGDTGARTGGHLVAEALAALGAEVVFGVPGIHALAIWEGLRDGPVRVCPSRTELAAGFSADGYARSSGRVAPLLLSTGPGALNSLTALMESASAHVPVLAISSEIPRELLGTGRGYLHKLADQRASFRPIVKHTARAESAEAIPELLAEAWTVALTPPSGPVYVEIPVDVLTGPAGRASVGELAAAPAARSAAPAAVVEAAELLRAARRPVIWAGSGVLRSGARAPLRALAERLDAPVATTFMGKGAISEDHPLAVGSGCDEAAYQELVGGADVLLAVGTELGADTTAMYELRLSGRLIHLDAAAGRIGVSYPALGLVGDAGATLAALLDALPDDASADREPGAVRAATVRDRIAAGLDGQGRESERGLLADIAAALPDDGISAWDMTILAYWAAAHLRLRADQQFLYPLGSGTLGYAWPAALGAALAHPDRRVLGVCGDGGLSYAVAELASARHHGIRATLLVIDDGGYGILREYQTADFGRTVAVDHAAVDISGLAAAYGVPVRSGGRDEAADNLRWALAQDGPAVVVVRAKLVSALPTA